VRRDVPVLDRTRRVVTGGHYPADAGRHDRHRLGRKFPRGSSPRTRGRVHGQPKTARIPADRSRRGFSVSVTC